jgi:hypothetical protein
MFMHFRYKIFKFQNYRIIVMIIKILLLNPIFNRLFFMIKVNTASIFVRLLIKYLI